MRKICFLMLMVAACSAGCCCPLGSAISDPPVATFTGDGDGDTKTFTVGNDWSYEFESVIAPETRRIFIREASTQEAVSLKDGGGSYEHLSFYDGGEYYFEVDGMKGPWKITVRQGSDSID